MRVASLVDRVRAQARLRRPRPCPPGWTVAPPDFVGLGAQRSGTTWLHSLVAAHPGVHGDMDKELHFFHRYWNRPFDDADADTYARYFARPPGLLAGEWSPGYLSHFWVPPLVARAAPDAGLLVSLRDPVERYRSGVVLQSETRRPGSSGASAAFRLGCYGLQLEHLLSYVERRRVHVVQFEACTRDPASALAGIYSFLHLDPGFRPDHMERRVNAGRSAKSDLDPATRAALVDAYEPDVRRLCALGFDLDLSIWPNFTHLA